MNRKIPLLSLLLALPLFMGLGGCQNQTDAPRFHYEEYPLEREGISLHLDRVSQEGSLARENILLVHGLTYSSHVFDVDYEDYSLVRFLAKEGYNVWRIDIAGYGRSGQVSDGFMPDSSYASEDINAAINRICEITSEDKIDVLGWSWGTVTSSGCVIKYPEHINKLTLFAPILNGIGENQINEPFHHNDYEHATEDFQKGADGEIDYSIVDPSVVSLFAANAWKYDGEYSPNGGRRDLSVAESITLIPLEEITVPTMIIGGDKDPYLNCDLLNDSLGLLPKGSRLEILTGASHVAYIERSYYKDFQAKLIDFYR